MDGKGDVPLKDFIGEATRSQVLRALGPGVRVAREEGCSRGERLREALFITSLELRALDPITSGTVEGGMRLVWGDSPPLPEPGVC